MDNSDAHAPRHSSGNGASGSAYVSGGNAGDAAGQYSQYQTQATPVEAALGWAKEHPLLCAAAVGAVIAIGPRRVVRTLATSGGALTALTLRNPSNIDALARLISKVGAYLQQKSAQK
jgi:hypothetical protein